MARILVVRILIVEDDPSQLDIRRQILEHAGYDVATAQDASEALERWQGCPVVVMDLRIPEPEDGARLIQAIAGRARIIVLSGGQVDPDLPVDEILTKPCPSRRLLAAIEKWASSVS
jgi:CheY-like chemotaxis protein